MCSKWVEFEKCFHLFVEKANYIVTFQPRNTPIPGFKLTSLKKQHPEARFIHTLHFCSIYLSNSFDKCTVQR